MKKLVNLFTFLLLSNLASAQIHEIGVFLGASNFIGDVGRTTYIYPKQPALGVLYKWNVKPRYSWRFSIAGSKIKGNDFDSDLASRNQRGYQFSNDVVEASAGFEFNFTNFNLHEYGYAGTPYLYTGLNYSFSENVYFENKAFVKTGGNIQSLGIPLIGGYKVKLNPFLVLGAEIGLRYTFTDNIDGSFPKKSNFETLKFGNTNSKDWYVFSGFTLTYTFGKQPCYCKE
jgi:hypothetical protein